MDSEKLLRLVGHLVVRRGEHDVYVDAPHALSPLKVGVFPRSAPEWLTDENHVQAYRDALTDAHLVDAAQLAGKRLGIAGDPSRISHAHVLAWLANPQLVEQDRELAAAAENDSGPDAVEASDGDPSRVQVVEETRRLVREGLRLPVEFDAWLRRVRISDPFTVVFCGSREWGNYPLVRQVMAQLLAAHPNLVVVQGDARGADRLAKRAARELGVPCASFPARWDRYGNRAGPIRNHHMASCSPRGVVAFTDDLEGSRGTRHMCRTGAQRDIPVAVYDGAGKLVKAFAPQGEDAQAVPSQAA